MNKYMLGFMLLFVCSNAHAVEVDKLVNAIYIAEGGANTSHPYGILEKYKTTTPRQACINTVNHALRDYTKEVFSDYEFIVFLGNRYCPVGAENDPTNLNKNWIPNVWSLYQKEMLK